MAITDWPLFECVSDITPVEYGLSDEELLILINRRYRNAGNPEVRLKGWLDDHDARPLRETVFERVLRLPHEGLISLLCVLDDWTAKKP